MEQTPGPWKYTKRSATDLWQSDAKFLVMKDAAWVAAVPTEADARLIAAAPDLLEACAPALLTQACEVLEELAQVVTGEYVASCESLARKLADKAMRARTAIAKATGN